MRFMFPSLGWCTVYMCQSNLQHGMGVLLLYSHALNVSHSTALYCSSFIECVTFSVWKCITSHPTRYHILTIPTEHTASHQIASNLLPITIKSSCYMQNSHTTNTIQCTYFMRLTHQVHHVHLPYSVQSARHSWKETMTRTRLWRQQ